MCNTSLLPKAMTISFKQIFLRKKKDKSDSQSWYIGKLQEKLKSSIEAENPKEANKKF